jgi:hypothetical protein
MTAPNYPNSPTIGQIFQVGTTTFEFDGVKWRSKVSSDPTLRAELAAVGSDVLISGVTASDLVDDVVEAQADIVNLQNRQLDTYASLRAYNGTESTITLRGRSTVGDGFGGVFVRLAVASTDNDGTRVNDALGRSWYLQHNGEVNIGQFGFVADFVLTLDDGIDSTGTGTGSTQKLQAMFDDVKIKKITGAPGKYWFGIVSPNQYKTTCSRPIEIDWRGAELFCTMSDPAAESISATLIQFLNTDLVHMHSFEFTQINWVALFAGGAGGRGVNPYIFRQTAGAGVLNRGVLLGNYIVRKGQSLVGFASDTAGVDRIEGVELYGSIVGESVYYGYNLFYSGHKLKGRIHINEFIRAWILNDVVDVDVEVVQNGLLSIATSSSGIINNNGNSGFACERINIKATFDQINGSLRLSAPDAVGAAAVIKNCCIDVYVDDFGSNLSKTNGNVMVLGAYDGGGTYITTGTITVTDNKVKIRVGQELDGVNDLFLAQTRTPNSLRNLIDAQRFDVSSFQNELTYYRSHFGFCYGHRGNLFSKPIELSMKKILNKAIGPDPFYVNIDIVLLDTDVPASHWVQRFVVYGSINSDGTETVRSATKVYEAGSGAYKPTLSFTTDPGGSPFITITAPTGESVANGRLTMLASPVAASVILL